MPVIATLLAVLLYALTLQVRADDLRDADRPGDAYRAGTCANNENEPPCADGYVDLFNAGCDADLPAFSPLTCGATVCGESGTYEAAAVCVGDANCDGEISLADVSAFVDGIVHADYCDGVGRNADLTQDWPTHVGFEDINPFVDLLAGAGLPRVCPLGAGSRASLRDTDWYAFSAEESIRLTWTVTAEFDPHIQVMAPGPDMQVPCAGAWLVAETAGIASTPVSVTTRCLAAGTYWLGVTTVASSGVACGADYHAALTCTSAECPPVACDPNEPGHQPEGEPCGVAYDTNSGCGDVGDPNDDLFTELAFVEAPAGLGILQAAVCGTLFAGEMDEATPSRDVDWYRYDVAGVEEVHYSVQTEVPLIATPVFSTEWGDVWYCGADQFGYWGFHQEPGSEQPTPTFLAYPGANYFVVQPEIAFDEPLYTGYPCASGDNTYVLRIQRYALGAAHPYVPSASAERR